MSLKANPSTGVHRDSSKMLETLELTETSSRLPADWHSRLWRASNQGQGAPPRRARSVRVFARAWTRTDRGSSLDDNGFQIRPKIPPQTTAPWLDGPDERKRPSGAKRGGCYVQQGRHHQSQRRDLSVPSLAQYPLRVPAADFIRCTR